VAYVICIRQRGAQDPNLHLTTHTPHTPHTTHHRPQTTDHTPQMSCPHGGAPGREGTGGVGWEAGRAKLAEPGGGDQAELVGDGLGGLGGWKCVG
jgi:hypothetical protein